MKKKLIYFVKKILTHDLIKGSSYLFVGSFIGSIFSFLFNLFLARKLTYGDYATYTSILSLVGLVVIPSQSLGTAIVKIAGGYLALGEEKNAHALYYQATKILAIIALFLFLLFLLAGGFLQTFLKIDNYIDLLIAATWIGISYISIVNSSFLQALLKFRYIALLGAGSSILKLLLGFILVSLSLRVYGALGAVLASSCMLFVLGFLPLLHILKVKKGTIRIPLKKMVQSSYPSILAILSLSAFISMDLILVKHFFSPTQAGYYAGISLVGKAIYYFTGTIPVVLFPLLIKSYYQKKNTIRLFLFALAIVAIPSLCITAFYFAFPVFVVKLFLSGRGYLQVISLLGWYGILTSIFSTVNVLTLFLLSLHKTSFVPLLVIGAVLQTTLIFLFHQTLIEVLGVSIVVLLVVLLSLLIYYLKVYGQEKTAHHSLRHHSSI